MGCGSSSPQNQDVVEQELVIVPFLNSQPRIVPQEDYQSSYFPFDSYNPNTEPQEKKETYECDMIDHSTAANQPTEPDMEMFKKQKFNECFSHIEVSTFQNVPIMSVQSHINMPSLESQQTDSINVNDYYELIDQVMSKIIPPLNSMSVRTNHELTL